MSNAAGPSVGSQSDPVPTQDFALRRVASCPDRIGRYRVRALLGEGGFGRVFLAQDDELDRPVAVKVPNARLEAQPEGLELYRVEAQIAARLEHPHIVRVFDVGATAEHPFFFVAQYIEGETLAQRLRRGRPPLGESVRLIATVALALHHAHGKGVVHRDVKPANILLDGAGRPYVSDFGLALREADVGREVNTGGTPAYMSPEQARGEGHRVDGRSDVYSLGVVLYELLTGRRPFGGETPTDVLNQIVLHEPRPPRQLDDSVPRELERICLKALAKRASDRYTTARDLADELLAFADRFAPERAAPPVMDSLATPPDLRATRSLVDANERTPPAPSSSDSRPLRVVPKGLRSFDGHDAEFFLSLLPGPRDGRGLPDSLRFWKTRIEPSDEESFSVGVLYGPSGCGKSSLIKAGLLPLLSAAVTPVFVEAAGSGTEERILTGLRRRCTGLAPDLALKDALAALRRGYVLPSGSRVLLVLDQFEQWLHARGDEEHAELVEALRQCDGVRVQALLLVRDDFWMGLTRFLRRLEVPLVEGGNAAAVDLFDARHARRVLTMFGRAFGALPEGPGELPVEQAAFLDQAVTGLAEDGKISPIRLAIMAEMVKDKEWVPATLKAVGGTDGIGVTFLEEAFTGPAAPPAHRLHEAAARTVLKALLPELGTVIRSTARTRADLLEASGYGRRTADFDDVLRLLERDLRLLSPSGGEEINEPGQRGEPSYQLTHDFLVPALRDWLHRKQKETARGRAQLRLADRTAVWQERPEARHLPSLLEWLKIRTFTRRRDWTGPERNLMRSADRYYGLRGTLALVGAALLGFAAWQAHLRFEAVTLRDRILNADLARMPALLQELDPKRRQVEPFLREALARAVDPDGKLRLALALVATDREQVAYLYDRLLSAGPAELAILRAALAPYRNELTEQLWNVLHDPRQDSNRRVRAACVLLEYAAADTRATECARFAVDTLLAESPLAFEAWKPAFPPEQGQVLDALAAALEDPHWGAVERRAITDFYRSRAAGKPDGLAPLEQRLARQEAAGANGSAAAKRCATLAAALAALGKGDAAWRLLVQTPTPTIRSFLIDRLTTSGIEPAVLRVRLEETRDVSVRRALVLALGGFPAGRSPDLIRIFAGLYENDSDPGVHSACDWALRHWHQQPMLAALDQKLAATQPGGGRNWYVNRQRQTFSVVTIRPGSDSAKPARRAYTLAVGATEVTFDQFRAFRPDHVVDRVVTTTDDSPVGRVSWHAAAEYCNWLSREEGIPESQWCYVRRESGQMEFVSNYKERTGYRLPAEDEWEQACRAGAVTDWHFGAADEELIGMYAWWLGNSGGRRAFPVATLKPNDWGLFDMHGNLPEWCQESTAPQIKEFNEIQSAARGGSFFSPYQGVGSSSRFMFPRRLATTVGFRVVRSLP